MQSSIFQLTHETTAAMDRHAADIESATPDERKAALQFITDHLTDLGLAIGFRNARAAAMAQLQQEHDAMIRNERIATSINNFKTASVGTLQGQLAFFTGAMNSLICALDGAGQVGTRGAERKTDAALSLIKQSGRDDYSIQLPTNMIAIRTDAGTWAKLVDAWKLPVSLAWSLNGFVYSIFTGSVPRVIDCGPVAFMQSCRCGADAVWIVEPSAVQLDDEGRLPALPADMADAVSNCAPKSERLLLKFLLD